MPVLRQCVRIGAVSGTGPADRSGAATRTTGGRGAATPTTTTTTARGVRTRAGGTAYGVTPTRPAGSAIRTGTTGAGRTGDGPI
jgi:hypothetical protein